MTSRPDESVNRVFETMRGRLVGLAYRMLGSYADAEDIVQDAWFRVASAVIPVRDPEAYLVTVVTRLCLDHLKSARARRECYTGPWLPEPIVSAEALSPATVTELADDLSFALLLTLDTLTPPERAAFLLHDVFDRPYSEIAQTLGKQEAACRQLATRARKAVVSGLPAGKASTDKHQQLLKLFAHTIASGDVEALAALLKDDVVAYSDGGGVKIAALRPIYGAHKVARLFIGVSRKYRRVGGKAGSTMENINGEPGLVIHIDGEIAQTLSIDVADDRISAIYMMRNPEKLRSLEKLLVPSGGIPH